MSERHRAWYTHDDLPKDYIPWHGGECPVDHDETIVAFYRDGDCEIDRAGDRRWSHIGEQFDTEGWADVLGYAVW